jgi:hypothetical protein
LLSDMQGTYIYIYFIFNFTVRVCSVLHFLQFYNFQASLNHKANACSCLKKQTLFGRIGAIRKLGGFLIVTLATQEVQTLDEMFADGAAYCLGTINRSAPLASWGLGC